MFRVPEYLEILRQLMSVMLIQQYGNWSNFSLNIIMEF